MRTFIKTRSGDYIDADTITAITTKGTSGGIVEANGQLVASVNADVKFNAYGEESSTEEKEARKKQAGVLAENLIHAIGRAYSVAKSGDGNGAVIHYDADATRWTITNLGKTAASPNFT